MPRGSTYELDAAIEAKLVALGITSAEVATSLLELGIKGVRAESSQCPIARYLSTELGVEAHQAGVTQSFSQVYNPEEEWEIECYTLGAVDNPQPVQEFIQAFDKGEHPDLIDDDD